MYAYRHGGASAVGLVGLIRWLPAAVASPFSAILGDRYPRVRVMLASDLLRAAGLAGMAVCVLTHAPIEAVYALAAAVAVTTTAFQPAQAAILPSLARTPEELTAANVSSSTIESLGFCVGPALGGLLLAVSTVWVVFVVTAATFLWSALMLTGLLRTTEPPLQREPTHLRDEAAAGFRAIARDRRLRLVVGLFSAQTLVNGAFTVLIAVSALELLNLGPSGVGYLNAAVGVGGLIGGLVSLTLIGHRRLATTFGIAVACTGGPLLLLGAFPKTGVALVVFALIGLAIIVEDVSGFTLLQRNTPSDVLSRVFGVLHSLFYGTVALGAILAPVLIDAVGVRWALVIAGSLLPGLWVLTRASLAKLDAAPSHDRELELLQSIPIFAPLSPPVLEQLASGLAPCTCAPARRSSARASTATASTSSPGARSRSCWTRARRAARGPAPTSARSPCSEMFLGQPRCERRPTPSSMRSTARTSWAQSPAMRAAPRRPKRSWARAWVSRPCKNPRVAGPSVELLQRIPLFAELEPRELAAAE